jgi:hypothetical protein
MYEQLTPAEQAAKNAEVARIATPHASNLTAKQLADLAANAHNVAVDAKAASMDVNDARVRAVRTPEPIVDLYAAADVAAAQRAAANIVDASARAATAGRPTPKSAVEVANEKPRG